MDSGDLRLLQPLLDRLATEPGSMWRASTLAKIPPDITDPVPPDPELDWLDWGRSEALLADIFDAVQLLTEVTRLRGSKRKPKLNHPYPRPGRRIRPEGPATLQALNRALGL